MIDKEKLNGIVKILESNERGSVIVQMSPFKNSVRLTIEGKMSDLYIKKTTSTYIISRVELENQRQGTMDSILKELIYIAKSESCNYIVVESVCSEAMRSFCIKHGFKKEENYLDIDTGIFGNYILNIWLC